MSPYCSAHDEWLIMKLCMYVGYHDANNVSNFGGDPVTQLNLKKCLVLFLCPSEDMSPYCSAHDEWLIMKVCMYVGYHDAKLITMITNCYMDNFHTLPTAFSVQFQLCVLLCQIG